MILESEVKARTKSFSFNLEPMHLSISVAQENYWSDLSSGYFNFIFEQIYQLKQRIYFFLLKSIILLSRLHFNRESSSAAL